MLRSLRLPARGRWLGRAMSTIQEIEGMPHSFQQALKMPGSSTASDGAEKKRYTKSLTKLVATIGPASENLPVIHDIVAAGK